MESKKLKFFAVLSLAVVLIGGGCVNGTQNKDTSKKSSSDSKSENWTNAEQLDLGETASSSPLHITLESVFTTDNYLYRLSENRNRRNFVSGDKMVMIFNIEVENTSDQTVEIEQLPFKVMLGAENIKPIDPVSSEYFYRKLEPNEAKNYWYVTEEQKLSEDVKDFGLLFDFSDLKIDNTEKKKIKWKFGDSEINERKRLNLD